MILLTAATGPTGLHILKHLVRRGAQVRAFVSKAASAEAARANGAASTFVGDVRRLADIDAAMHGVDKIFHICPRFDEDEIAVGDAMINAAKKHGVQHFIYYSVIHGQIEALTHHRDKRIVEGNLMESLIPYTILQPTMYMQSTTREWAAIKQTGEFKLPQSTDMKMSVVDLEDVGAAAAAVTMDPGWVGGCFELCNGEQITRAEMAKLMGDAIGRPVKAVRQDIEEWQAHVVKVGHFTPAQVKRVRTMQEHYAKYGLGGGNGRVLELLIGRKPITYRDYVARIAKA
jgi:uncharacterized protein YbjT (DUF2867 family)